MVSYKWIRCAAVTLGAFGTTIPTAPVMAGGHSALRPAIQSVKAKVFDIVLSSGATFQGRVVDHTGAPVEQAEVVVKQNNTEVGRAVTDKTGTFVIGNLKSGVYSVTTGNSEGIYRVWTEDSAPPSAKARALLVMGENGIRGNFGAANGDYSIIVISAFVGGVAVLLATTIAKYVNDNKTPVPISP